MHQTKPNNAVPAKKKWSQVFLHPGLDAAAFEPVPNFLKAFRAAVPPAEQENKNISSQRITTAVEPRQDNALNARMNNSDISKALFMSSIRR